MTEYIEREAALSLVRPDTPEDEEYVVTIATAKKLVRSIVRRTPAADVAPIVHARWITRSDKGIISMTHPYMCSRCWRVEMNKEPYCHCGAKMDSESDTQN